MLPAKRFRTRKALDVAFFRLSQRLESKAALELVFVCLHDAMRWVKAGHVQRAISGQLGLGELWNRLVLRRMHCKSMLLLKVTPKTPALYRQAVQTPAAFAYGAPQTT